ncbi:hypothetical protein ACI8AC_24180, partial [Geodermatophilus sp. SYSU D00758]
MLAFLAASAAVIVSSVSLQRQAEANTMQAEANTVQSNATNDQLRFNKELREERQRQYASRVSWWLDYADSANSLTIQNRSTVPINGVVLRYKAASADDVAAGSELDGVDFTDVPVYDGYPVVTMDLIPPCSIAILNATELERMVTTIGESSSIDWDHIQFEDVNGVWSVSEAGQPVLREEDNRPRGGHGDIWIRGTAPGSVDSLPVRPWASLEGSASCPSRSRRSSVVTSSPWPAR